MACYSPWVPAGSSSKRAVRCGQCIGCRLEYSRQWAVRVMHEASMHEFNSFVTLTYAEDPYSLRYEDFQLFMRRLRRERGYARFFCSGEYGEKCGACSKNRLDCRCVEFVPALGRPHFHAALFGVRFADGLCMGKSAAGFKFYSSESLSQLWQLGHASFGDVTFESAAYVARYVVKKVTGEDSVQHYAGRVPEFARMSLKPGIGATWLEKYWSDVFPACKVVSRGHVGNAPRFYRKKFAARFPALSDDLLYEQSAEVQARVEDNFPQRLEAKVAVQRARLAMLKRKL